MSLLTASGISMSRGSRRVLDAVSATFQPGRISVVLGPNGAGKTSLLLALAGLLTPESGSVTLDGAPLASLSPRARGRRIGYLAQASEVHWDLTVRAVVALGRYPHRSAFAGLSVADESAIDRAMQAADITQLAERPVRQLSGGERARVLLARLVAGEPEVVLADEPLANLDLAHQADSLALFRRLADAGAAVALVLHDLTAAARIADNVVLMDGGRVLAAGPPQDVLVPERLGAVYGVAISIVSGPDGTRLVVPGGRIG